jgi:ABC-type nitrate/sulfonate/bicarbonate transport system substrate-binding protein
MAVLFRLLPLIFLLLLPRSLFAFDRVTFAYPSPSTSYLPLVAAYKQGFFEQENIQAELVQVRPAVAIPGVTINSVDFTTALQSSISARMRGAPLVIAGVFSDKPMDFLVGAKGVRSAKELKGRVVGISAVGTQTYFLTVRLLKAIGLEPERDVTLRPVGDEGVRLQALQTGLIHATALGSQGVIQADKDGLKVIAASADVIPSLAFAGLATNTSKLKENPQLIKRVLRAGLKGLRYVHENRAGTINVLESWYRLDRELASASYDLARKSYSANGEVDLKGVELNMEFARLTGKIEKESAPSDMVNFALLREARKELGW